jgi:branched-chain amino acid transport system substrate-binding protein
MNNLISILLLAMACASPLPAFAMGTGAEAPTAADESDFVVTLTPAQTLALLNEHFEAGTVAQVTATQVSIAAEHAITIGDDIAAYRWYTELAVREEVGILARADLAISRADFPSAIALATLVVHSAHSKPRDVLSARFVLRQATEQVQVAPDVVALLLPLSGKFGAVGKSVEKVILSSKPDDATFTYVTIDTADTIETATAAVEQAVFQYRAIAAIGPLRTDFGVGVATAAEDLRLPILVLSKSVSAVDYDNWVYQTRFSIEDEISALLDEVMDKRQLKSFGIFAPLNDYGTTASAAFVAGVESRGGAITVHTTYDPAAKDMLPFAQIFSRKDYERDSAIFYKMKRAAKKKGRDTQTMVLPPVLDFEAIFVPDNHARLPIALASLAYEEVPMGRYRPGQDKRSIPLLGLSTWNHPKLPLSGGAYVRDSVFIDLFSPLSASALTFVEAFKQENRRLPSSLEAASYDVGVVTAHVLQTKPTTRAMFVSNLHDLNIAPTATGVTGVAPDAHMLTHSALLLTIVNRGIIPITDTAQ